MARRVYFESRRGGMFRRLFLTSVLTLGAYYAFNKCTGKDGLDAAEYKVNKMLYDNRDLCGKIVMDTLRVGEDHCPESIEGVIYSSYDHDKDDASKSIGKLCRMDEDAREKVFRPYGTDKGFIDSAELRFYMKVRDHMRYPIICDDVGGRCYTVKLKEVMGERILQLDPYAIAKERMEDAKNRGDNKKSSLHRYSLSLIRGER